MWILDYFGLVKRWKLSENESPVWRSIISTSAFRTEITSHYSISHHITLCDVLHITLRYIIFFKFFRRYPKIQICHFPNPTISLIVPLIFPFFHFSPYPVAQDAARRDHWEAQKQLQLSQLTSAQAEQQHGLAEAQQLRQHCEAKLREARRGRCGTGFGVVWGAWDGDFWKNKSIYIRKMVGRTGVENMGIEERWRYFEAGNDLNLLIHWAINDWFVDLQLAGRRWRWFLVLGSWNIGDATVTRDGNHGQNLWRRAMPNPLCCYWQYHRV